VKHPNWPGIRRAFLEGQAISLIARRYRCRAELIERRAMRENWRGQRSRIRLEQSIEASVRQAADAETPAEAERAAKAVTALIGARKALTAVTPDVEETEDFELVRTAFKREVDRLVAQRIAEQGHGRADAEPD